MGVIPLQGIPTHTNFPGSSLEQAYLIWNQTPRQMMNAILKQLDVTLPDDYIQNDIFTVFQSNTLKNEDGSPADVLYMRYIPPTSFKSDPTKKREAK